MTQNNPGRLKDWAPEFSPYMLHHKDNLVDEQLSGATDSCSFPYFLAVKNQAMALGNTLKRLMLSS